MTRAVEYAMPPATALRHGVVAAQAREFDRARELLQQVIEQMPDDVLGWYWMAIASPSAEAAIPCLRRVLDIDRGHTPAQEALARLLLTEARKAANAGERDEARRLAVEATTLLPDNPSPWQVLAEIAPSQVARIDALRRLVALAPEDPAPRTQLRQALLARAVMIANSDRAEARIRFREVATLNPHDVRIWQALSNLAESRDEQIQCLRALLRIAPDHQQGRPKLRQVLIDDAHQLLAAMRVDEARDRWREAIEITGGDVELWLGLARATQDEEEAARAVESAYALDPNDPRAIEAIERYRAPQIDPAALPVHDAFARFDDELEQALTAPPESEPVDEDSLLNGLAELSVEPSPVPTETAPEPVVVAESPVELAPVAQEPQADLELALQTQVEFAPPTQVEFAPPAQVELAPPAQVEIAPPVQDDPVLPPVEPAPAAALPDDGATVAATAPAVAEDAPTVMVVDDSPTIRKILGLTLERAGYRVFAEANGESALQRLQQIVPRVILLDISMPDLDGYEVCKRIKQDPRTAAVPVIMLSGKGAFFDKVKGHLAGATEYLTKPFETPAVLAVVTSHCQAQTATEAHHG
jgi:twitching motility two-component system response regulator PilG